MKKQQKEILVLGAALFSMFFGAGNLIFPPYLGLEAGSKWLPALIGFFLTGIGLPLLGVIASAKSNGDIHQLGEGVSKGFSRLISIVMVISIGPLVAIPRTGATAFEMGILPMFPNFSPAVFAAIFFGTTLLLVLNPGDIIDNIGKILTPGLLILLGIIILKGVFDPMGTPVDKGDVSAFANGFTGGYQTMDALASLLFGGMIINSLKNSGYDKVEDQVSMTVKAGIVAVIGLTFVYGGLGYLGATASAVYPNSISRVNLIMNIANHTLMSFGEIGLGIVVSLACLTTAVGLVSTVGNYFSELSNGKLKYTWVAVGTAIFSAVMSVTGVESIVAFADPILSFIYPVVIVLIVLAITIGNEGNTNIHKVSVIMTLVISTLDLISNLSFGGFATDIISYLPFNEMGLHWVIPALIGGVIGSLIKEKETAAVK